MPARGCQCRGSGPHSGGPDQRTRVTFQLAAGTTPACRSEPYITLACLAVVRECEQDPHGCVAVESAEIGTSGWFPDEPLHSPNSRRISSCGMPGAGSARAASMRASISGSKGASVREIRNSRYRNAAAVSASGNRSTKLCRCSLLLIRSCPYPNHATISTRRRLGCHRPPLSMRPFGRACIME